MWKIFRHAATFLRIFTFYLIALSGICFAGMINTWFLSTFDSYEHQIIFQCLITQ